MGKPSPREEGADAVLLLRQALRKPSVATFCKIRYDRSTGFLYCFGFFLLTVRLDQVLRTFVFSSLIEM